MSAPDLQSLAQTVTSKQLVPETSSEAISMIILHTERAAAAELLDRKKITKELMFEYLHFKRVPIESKAGKIKHALRVLKLWGSAESVGTLEEIVPGNNGNDESSSSSAQPPRSIRGQPLVVPQPQDREREMSPTASHHDMTPGSPQPPARKRMRMSDSIRSTDTTADDNNNFVSDADDSDKESEDEENEGSAPKARAGPVTLPSSHRPQSPASEARSLTPLGASSPRPTRGRPLSLDTPVSSRQASVTLPRPASASPDSMTEEE